MLKPFLESSMNWPVVRATVFRFAGIAPLTAEIYLSANPRFQSRYSSSEISPESRLARIVNLNLPRFRLHPYAAFRRRSSSGRLARSNSSGLRYPSAECVLTLL